MKIAILGYGKMGQMIEKLALAKNHEIVLKSDSRRPFTVEDLKDSGAEVAIEFTEPESAVKNIFKCFDAGVPVVTGTTGWFLRLPEVREVCASKNGTLFYASNFSIGVNIFQQVSNHLARLMNEHPSYDVSMEEIHHTEKKDVPSGTAITLAEGLLDELDRKKDWVSNTNATEDELLITSLREPKVPGTHSITYEGEEDKIVILHEAKGRKGFAAGALRAAEWVSKKEGVYTMRDLLKL